MSGASRWNRCAGALDPELVEQIRIAVEHLHVARVVEGEPDAERAHAQRVADLHALQDAFGEVDHHVLDAAVLARHHAALAFRLTARDRRDVADTRERAKRRVDLVVRMARADRGLDVIRFEGERGVADAHVERDPADAGQDSRHAVGPHVVERRGEQRRRDLGREELGNESGAIRGHGEVPGLCKSASPSRSRPRTCFRTILGSARGSTGTRTGSTSRWKVRFKQPAPRPGWSRTSRWCRGWWRRP